eukprot:1137770-Pelagomonas_calceolata.AAC.18
MRKSESPHIQARLPAWVCMRAAHQISSSDQRPLTGCNACVSFTYSFMLMLMAATKRPPVMSRCLRRGALSIA